MPKGKIYGAVVAVLLGFGLWSGFTISFQTELFSLFPQDLPSLKELRKIRADQTVTQKVFIVVDPASGWTAEHQEDFFGSLQKVLASEVLVAETERGFAGDGSGGEKARSGWLASLLASLPEEQFRKMAERVEPGFVRQRLENLPSRMSGALDEEDVMRLRLDPLGLLEEVGLPVTGPEAASVPVLQVLPAIPSESFAQCQQLEKALNQAVEKTLAQVGRPGDGEFVFLTGDPIFTAQIAANMKQDIIVMVSFTLSLVLAAFWIVYRSARPLGWIALSMLLSVSAALIAARVLIGEVNVISMGFASILMGIGVDYCILVYHHFASGHQAGTERWRLLTKGIWFSSGTTALAFGVLYFASFPGLQQLAVLVGVGLLASAGFATTFLAWILSTRPPRHPPDLNPWADRWGTFLEKSGNRILVISLLVLVACVGICFFWDRGLFYDPDIKRLQPSQLDAYRGQELMQSLLASGMTVPEVRDSNRMLWEAGRGTGVEEAAEAAGMRSLLEGTLSVIGILDSWKAGELSLPPQMPGVAEWVALREDLDRVAVRDFGKLTLVMLVIMVTLCFLAHRSLRLVLLNLGSLLVVLILLAGILRLLDFKLSLVSLLCIPLIIGVTLDYTMHMLIGLEHEKDGQAKAFRHLLVPISLTGLASMIGFTAPALGSQPALMNFGLVMDVGILCAIVTALMILPLVHRFLSLRGRGSHYSSLMYHAGAFQLAAWMAERLPRKGLRALAEAGGWIYARLRPDKVEVVRRNLDLLNEPGIKTRAAEARQVYPRFAATLCDYFYVGTHQREEAMALVKERIGYNHLCQAYDMGRGCILLTPHQSLFELGGVIMSELGFSSVALTIPEPQSSLTEWRRAFRRRWGVETLEIGRDSFASLAILNCLKENKFVIALVDRPLTSQNARVTFPGGELEFAGGILQMAAMAKCPVMVATVEELEGGFYRTEAMEPFMVETKESREETLRFNSQKVADLILPALKRHRTQWFQFVPLQKES